MMSVLFSSASLITDKTKVLLYNFFEDSTATLDQWRLLLNEVPGGDNSGRRPPVFDETRHASICIEVRCIWLEHLRNPSCCLG